MTALVWPSRVCTVVPVFRSYSLTVVSQDADASSWPSREKAIAETALVWPSRVCTVVPVLGSHSLTVSSQDADASC